MCGIRPNRSAIGLRGREGCWAASQMKFGLTFSAGAVAVAVDVVVAVVVRQLGSNDVGTPLVTIEIEQMYNIDPLPREDRSVCFYDVTS